MQHNAPIIVKEELDTPSLKLSILLVEDSIVILEKMRESLSELTCIGDLKTALNALDAMGILKKDPIDVVLLDINLPGINGIDVLRYIKKNHPLTIVIMVTNHSKDEYRNACLKLGAEYFIDKSAEFERIPLLLQEISIHKSC
jgi:DNA-binding NarL/FixJ family response regulator